jgi:hypothetical protein
MDEISSTAVAAYMLRGCRMPISGRKMAILARQFQIFAVLYKIRRHLIHKQRQDSLKYVVGKHGVTAGTLAVQSKANRPVFGMKKVNHQASPHTRE